MRNTAHIFRLPKARRDETGNNWHLLIIHDATKPLSGDNTRFDITVRDKREARAKAAGAKPWNF